MSNGQARAGGEYGLNGEWYEGGQFLPSSPETVKGAQKKVKRTGGRKQQVAAYVWEIPPTDTAKSIFAELGGTYVERDGDKFKRFEPYLKYCASTFKDWDETIKGWKLDELIKMYNEGEKWFEPR